jgi:hypothetical protein
VFSVTVQNGFLFREDVQASLPQSGKEFCPTADSGIWVSVSTILPALLSPIS